MRSEPVTVERKRREGGGEMGVADGRRETAKEEGEGGAGVACITTLSHPPILLPSSTFSTFLTQRAAHTSAATIIDFD